MAQGTDQAIYCHRGHFAQHGTAFQAEPSMGGEEDLTGYRRGHRAIAQDEVREDCEHRSARRALKPPDEDATKTDAEVMGMTRQASSTATCCLVLQLKAYG